MELVRIRGVFQDPRENRARQGEMNQCLPFVSSLPCPRDLKQRGICCSQPSSNSSTWLEWLGQCRARHSPTAAMWEPRAPVAGDAFPTSPRAFLHGGLSSEQNKPWARQLDLTQCSALELNHFLFFWLQSSQLKHHTSYCRFFPPEGILLLHQCCRGQRVAAGTGNAGCSDHQTLSPFFALLKQSQLTKLTLPKHASFSNSITQSPQCSQIIPALAFRQQALGNKADAEPGLCLHNLCAAETELELHKPPWQSPIWNLKAPRSASLAE